MTRKSSAMIDVSRKFLLENLLRYLHTELVNEEDVAKLAALDLFPLCHLHNRCL